MTAHSKYIALTSHLPTTSALVGRLLIYQPTREPVTLTGEWITTPWGRARIKGAVGQRHADVMEIMQRTALQVHHKKDGRVDLLIDPYVVRRAMASPKQKPQSKKRSPSGAAVALYSGRGLDALIDGLRDADVEWEMKGGKRGGVTKIVQAKEWAKVYAHDPLRPDDDRALWRITLSAQWVALMGDLGLWYDPSAIVHMTYAISQAAARLVLGHDRKKWYGRKLSFKAIFDQMQIPQGQPRWDAKRRIHQDAKRFAEYGLEIDGDQIVDTSDPSTSA
ncbi:MAG: hypothetical protein M0Z68_03905 [Gammaproteobacteria bacterium]|nr:hypothetical protein [Gammaproteobacteria bacterium]